MDKLKKDYEDSILALKIFVDTSNERMNTPVQVSFLNIRTFLQDIEVTVTSKDVLIKYFFSINSYILNYI